MNLLRTNRLRRGLSLAAVVVAISEVTFTMTAFVSMTYRRGVPSDIAAQRLLLTKWLLFPFLSTNARIKPYTGGRQRYIGELAYDSSQWIEFTMPDALFGSRNGRNITAFENDSVYVTNDEGFASLGDRDFHYGLAHPDQRYRIILVGGSAVFGWRAGTPDRSLPARLNVSLKRYGPDLAEVINAGVPAYDSAQEFLYVASELIHYKPDLLVVYDGWNDESKAELTRSYIYPSLSEPQERAGGGNLFRTSNHLFIEERFKASLSVFGSARLLAGNIGAHVRVAMRHSGLRWLIDGLARQFIPERQSTPDPLPPYDPTLVTRYEENLTNVLNLADQNGVRVALFLQPIMWIDGRTPTTNEMRVAQSDVRSISARQAFYADARQMFARLRERRQREGKVCIEDLSQILKDTTEAIYADSGHLFERGNEIVADEIAKGLSGCRVLTN